MTTIIVTERAVAADGMVSGNGYVSWANDKKIRRYEGSPAYSSRIGRVSASSVQQFPADPPGICGIAGIGSLDHLEGAWRRSDLPDIKTKTDWVFLRIPDKSAVVYEYTSDYPYEDPIPIPMAWGSGGLIARALLRAEVPLQRIIEIVTEMDQGSGGEWTVLERR